MEDPLEIYQQRAARYAAEAQQLRRRDWHLSLARGLVFLLGLALVVGLWVDLRMGWAVAICAAAFILLAGWHEHLLLRLRQVELLSRIHRQHVARVDRLWRDLPVPAVQVPLAYQALARDLDLFGPRSLFQWLCVAHTPMGRDTLRDWLLQPAPLNVLGKRQQLVRALAAQFDWRESLELHGSLLGTNPESPAEFVAWATSEAWLPSHRWLHVLAWLVPALLVLLAIAYGTGTLERSAALWMLGGLLSSALVLSMVFTSRIYAIFDRVVGPSDQVRHYRAMLQLASQVPAELGPLEVGGRDLRAMSHEALRRIDQLRPIVQLINARRDGLLGLVHLVAQLIFLWNIHLLAWLERWQRRHGPTVPAWFEALGQLEALASLAHLAHDQPQWSFATVDPTASRLQATALGHPLLPNDMRVGNDVELGPAGTFLLVTGSNMSGKSTLLRSLGVNTLLAQAGSVVCAQQLVMPPLVVETSIHVDDSLAEGVSFYLAELRRMKQVVDRARETKHGSVRLLYLLDEILQGTNSRERQVAVVSIIHHLLAQDAIGAVSTHDLELASRQELREACRVVHFRETLGWDGERSTMTFDYQLRPGVAPTTNALVLLEMVGLEQVDADGE